MNMLKNVLKCKNDEYVAYHGSDGTHRISVLKLEREPGIVVS